MDYICPKGHASAEADYCSECGARIDGAGSGPERAGEAGLEAAAGAGSGAVEGCPECGAPREPREVVFCEICGFNFVTGVRGEMPFRAVAAPAVAPPPMAETAAVSAEEELVPAAVPVILGWEVVVSVDAALREAGSPDVPVGLGPFTFALEAPASLVGRRSEARAIFPEIALSWDDAVSHRHALLEIEPGGGLLLRDIGSANGTRVNGVEVAPMTDQRLADGDQIALGHWTRMVVKAKE